MLAHARRYVAADGLAAAAASAPSAASASADSAALDAEDAATARLYIGPMVSDVQRQVVHRHVLAARAAGARLLLGGEMPISPPVMPPASSDGGTGGTSGAGGAVGGTFYPPTVLADVPHHGTAPRFQASFGWCAPHHSAILQWCPPLLLVQAAPR